MRSSEILQQYVDFVINRATAPREVVYRIQVNFQAYLQRRGLSDGAIALVLTNPDILLQAEKKREEDRCRLSLNDAVMTCAGYAVTPRQDYPNNFGSKRFFPFIGIVKKSPTSSSSVGARPFSRLPEKDMERLYGGGEDDPLVRLLLYGREDNLRGSSETGSEESHSFEHLLSHKRS